MAERIEYFEILIPAGTLASAPQRSALAFPDGVVTALEIFVPPGPSGFVGFRFDYGGQQIIPRTVGTFITADSEVIKWPVTGFPTGAQWQLLAFNTDIYDHTLYIRFLVDEFTAPSVPPREIVPIPVGE